MTLTTPLMFGGLVTELQFNEQTDDYVLTLADAGKCVQMNKGTSNTLTVPTNAAVAFPIGTQIMVEQVGAGQTTVAGAGPPTINSLNGELSLTAQYATAVLLKTGTDTWLLSGEIGTP